MSYLLDEVSRTLASPLPRRKALKLAGGLLMGGLASALWPKGANAQDDAVACHPACTRTQKCCPAANGSSYCAPTAAVCCGNTSRSVCQPTAQCCGHTVCCPATRHCCQVNGNPVCCGVGLECRNGRCTASRA